MPHPTSGACCCSCFRIYKPTKKRKNIRRTQTSILLITSFGNSCYPVWGLFFFYWCEILTLIARAWSGHFSTFSNYDTDWIKNVGIFQAVFSGLLLVFAMYTACLAGTQNLRNFQVILCLSFWLGLFLSEFFANNWLQGIIDIVGYGAVTLFWISRPALYCTFWLTFSHIIWMVLIVVIEMIELAQDHGSIPIMFEGMLLASISSLIIQHTGVKCWPRSGDPGRHFNFDQQAQDQ